MNWNKLDAGDALVSEAMITLAAIRGSLLHSSNSLNYSLLGGNCGIGLFFLHHYRFSGQDEDLEKVVQILENCNKNIEQLLTAGKTLSSGITGYGWLLQHAENTGILDVDGQAFLNALDDNLYPIMETEMDRGNYDYLHGAIGIGLYFLSRPVTKKNTGFLESLVKRLKKIAVKIDDFYIWEAYDFKKRQTLRNSVNLSLSHGISGILLFLIKLYRRNILLADTSDLIMGIFRYLKSCQLNDKSKYFVFPSFTSLDKKEEANTSRLAWCYGDLGVCYSLYKTAELFDDFGSKKEILKLYDFETTRKDRQADHVWDAGFCHGTSGIAYIFNKLYQETGSIVFKEAAIHWYRETIDMGSNNAGVAGYQYFTVTRSWVNQPGLLDGLAGTGISLLSMVSCEYPLWDEIFLLN